MINNEEDSLELDILVHHSLVVGDIQVVEDNLEQLDILVVDSQELEQLGILVEDSQELEQLDNLVEDILEPEQLDILVEDSQELGQLDNLVEDIQGLVHHIQLELKVQKVVGQSFPYVKEDEYDRLF